MMNVIVFGATGGTGRALIQEALTRGYRVTAFVRSTSQPLATHPCLTVVTGDVLQPDMLPQALHSQQAVLCALGRKPFVSAPVCSMGTQHIVAEMQRQGIQRLIVESSIGVGDSLAQSSLPQKLLFRTLLRSYFADKAVQERAVRESTLGWTIVRPVTLTDGPATNRITAKSDARMERWGMPSVARADVATFMLNQLEQPTFLHQCPILY